LFFVVLDDCNPDADRQVARHILNVHKCQDQAAQPPFTKDQMRRYLKFARTLHPKLTPESRKVLVDCYRKLRQGDTLGRSGRSAYRITVRQLESLIRLSEALARLYCADTIEPAYVREASRLLKTSIIQVETSDVVLEDEDEDDGQGGGQGGTLRGNDDEDDEESPGDETQDQQMETQQPVVPNCHPGEYNESEEQAVPARQDDEGAAGGAKTDDQGDDGDDAAAVAAASAEPLDHEHKKKKKKKAKRKTKIGFEEYQAMTHALAGHLRDLEEQQAAASSEASVVVSDPYLSWGALVEWYLEQYEKEIGDSLEVLEDMKSKVNLVIRRLIAVDRILVTVGDAPTSKRHEPETLLAVHPNYELS
jgi:DNA replication licensing factor MCM6